MSTRKTSTILIIGLVILAVTAGGCLALQQSQSLVPPDIPGEVVYIPYPVEITVDGDLADWEDLPIIEVVDEEARDPAENGSFSFSLAADMETFYITMQMPDKTIIAGEHRNEYWNEDSFEFYLNASGNLEARRYAEKIFQININATDIGNTDPDALTA